MTNNRSYYQAMQNPRRKLYILYYSYCQLDCICRQIPMIDRKVYKRDCIQITEEQEGKKEITWKNMQLLRSGVK